MDTKKLKAQATAEYVAWNKVKKNISINTQLQSKLPYESKGWKKACRALNSSYSKERLHRDRYEHYAQLYKNITGKLPC